MLVWDRGRWEPSGDPEKGLAEGKLLFTIHGLKLKGQWELVRIKPKDGQRGDPWILFKKRDAYARSNQDYEWCAACTTRGPRPGPAAAPPQQRRTHSRVPPCGKAAACRGPKPGAGAIRPRCRRNWPRMQADAPHGQWIFESQSTAPHVAALDARNRAYSAQRQRLVEQDTVLIDELAALN